MMFQLPRMFQSFDDKIQQLQEVKDTIYPVWEILDAGDEFPLEDILEIAVPLVWTDQPESAYSPQQLKFQRWYESTEGQDTKKQLVGTATPVKLAAISVVAIAYSTGSMNIAASSPEIQRYDESAYASGVGGFSMI
jgi:hypothetical protein